MKDDTSTSGPLFETSNTEAAPTLPQKDETSGLASATSSPRPKKLPRRWMPTMAPRTRQNPTLGMSLTWKMANSGQAARLCEDLEELLRASLRCALNLPGWQVHWQLSKDPRAAYRLGLLLWMEPCSEPER